MIEIVFWISVWTVISSFTLVLIGVAVMEGFESKPNKYAPDWLEYCGYGIVFMFWLSLAILLIYGTTWFVTNIVQWILGG